MGVFWAYGLARSSKLTTTTESTMSTSTIYSAIPNNPKTNFARVSKLRSSARKSGEVKVLKPDADGNLRPGTRNALTEQQREARAYTKNLPYQFGF